MKLMEFILRTTTVSTAVFFGFDVFASSASEQCTCICRASERQFDISVDCESDISLQSITCAPGQCRDNFYLLQLEGGAGVCWCDTLCTCGRGQGNKIDDTCDCNSRDSSTPSADKITSERTHTTPSRPLTSITEIKSTPNDFNSVFSSAKVTDSFSTNPIDFNSMSPPAGLTYGLINTDPSTLSVNNKAGIGIGIAFGLAVLALTAIVILFLYKRKSQAKNDREYIGIYTEPGKLTVGSSRGNMDNPNYEDIVEGTSGQTKEIQTNPNATMVLTIPSFQYTDLIYTDSNDASYSIQNDKVNVGNPNYEDIIEGTSGKTKEIHANPNTTMVTTPSSQYMDLVYTDSNEASQGNLGEYADPTFSASQHPLTTEGNKPENSVKVDMPVETPRFRSVPSGVSSHTRGVYVDVDAPGTTHENDASRDDQDNTGYSRLQHIPNNAFGSTTYDLLKHDVTQRAVKSNSSNKDYGKLDIPGIL